MRPPAGRSQLLGAVGAVDVVRVEHEALVGQAEAALLAVEAVLVPGEALVVHHVGAVTEPCSGTRGGRDGTHTGGTGRDAHGGGDAHWVTRQQQTQRRGRSVWIGSVQKVNAVTIFSAPLDFTAAE